MFKIKKCTSAVHIHKKKRSDCTLHVAGEQAGLTVLWERSGKGRRMV